MSANTVLNIQRENSADLLADANAWDALSGGNPMRQSIWLRTWWECFSPSLGDDAELYLITARHHDGRLTAVLPLYRHRRQNRVVLAALGQGVACTDHLSLLRAADEDAFSLARQVGTWLADAAKSPTDYWDLLDIDGMVEGDAAIDGLAAGLQDQRATVQATSKMNLWFKPTRADTWEEYLSRLSKTNRKKTRRRSTRVDDEPSLQWRNSDTSAQLLQSIDSLIEIHQARWQASGEPGSFASDEMRRFIKTVAQRLRDNQQLRLPVVTRDGQVVAVEFQILGDDEVLYCYSSAMDNQHQDIEPGHIISASTLRFAYTQGLAGMDMMRGDEPYKERLQGKPKRVVHLQAVAPSLAPRLKQAAWDAAFGAKQWLRAQLGRAPVAKVEVRSAN